MRLRNAVIGLVLTIVAMAGSITPTYASSTTESTPRAADRNASVVADSPRAVDLCQWFRPYGTGYVTSAMYVDSHSVRCVVLYGTTSSQCYIYYVRWWGGWNGPFDILRCDLVG
jgi:hypothetical protein